MISKIAKMGLVMYFTAGPFVLTPAFSAEQATGGRATADRSPSAQQEKAEPAQAQQIEIKSENIEKTLPSCAVSLKKIIEEAEKNIARIDGKIKEREQEERNKEREVKVHEYFDRGNSLEAEGKLEEARAEWEKALEITRDPEMRGYIKESEKRAREGEKARRKSEKAEEKARKEQERKACETK